MGLDFISDDLSSTFTFLKIYLQLKYLIDLLEHFSSISPLFKLSCYEVLIPLGQHGIPTKLSL